MDSCSSLELSLSLKPSYVPKTITKLLNDLSKIDNFSDKLVVLNDYLQKHQEELSRIEAIKHEIPQCMFLLMDAIETLKEEVMNIKSSEQQHLLEFLSMKRRSYEKMQKENFEKYFREKKNAFISSPSSCSQLYGLNHGEMNQKPILDSCTNIQGSQELEKGIAGCGNLNMRVNNKALNFQSKPILKPNIGVKHFRRSWTPELHSRFVEALEFLGGAEAATPKQIREIMKIEGLTNDQVKSHLQKFRLHNRRVPAANMINPMEYVQKFKDPWKSEFNYIGIQPLARDAQED